MKQYYVSEFVNGASRVVMLADAELAIKEAEVAARMKERREIAEQIEVLARSRHDCEHLSEAVRLVRARGEKPSGKIERLLHKFATRPEVTDTINQMIDRLNGEDRG